MRIASALMSLALLCTGCSTSLGIKRAAPGLDIASRTGIVYPLPFTQFNVTVTRVVTACLPQAIKLATKAEAVQATVASDPSQTFLIDSTSLSGPLRTGAVKVEYTKNGVAKGFNGTSEDHSAQVIANVIGGLVKIATLGLIPGPIAPVPAVASTVPLPPPEPACSPEVSTALAEISTTVAELSSLSVASTSATKALAALKTQADALGPNVDEATKGRLVAAKVASDVALTKVTAAKTKLEKLRAGVTDVQLFAWPSTGSEFSATKKPPEFLVEQWKNPKYTKELNPLPDLLLSLVRPNSDEIVSKGVEDQAEPSGVPYRMAQPGRLLICDGDCKLPNRLVNSSAGILQLGTMYYMPCKSGAFSSTSCAVAMDETGTPVSMGAEQKTSSAEGLSAAAKEGLTQLVAYRKAKSTAELDSVNAQLEYNKARKALAASMATNPNQQTLDETAALKADIDYWTAVKADADARAAAGQ